MQEQRCYRCMRRLFGRYDLRVLLRKFDLAEYLGGGGVDGRSLIAFDGSTEARF